MELPATPRERSRASAAENPSGTAPRRSRATSRIAVLLATHDRREQTLRCLRHLREQRLPPHVTLHVVMVDDASSDGTAQAVSAEFPDARIVHGSGKLYWNGAMRIAATVAMAEGHDFYLLLNDDTALYPDAVATLLDTARLTAGIGAAGAIVVGSLQAPERGGLTYGGWRCSGGRSALHMRKVAPFAEPSPCDTFNGNCVLVPDAAMRALGNLDRAFTHAMGDNDLGLRARSAGIRSFIAPGYVGACELNTGRGSWVDESLPIVERWRKLVGPKGLPPREWLVFTERHGGPLWPLYWVNPYLKFWLSAGLRLLVPPSRGARTT